MEAQTTQNMHKFQKSILALDPYAEFLVDKNPLKVIHSKCGGRSTQKATNDTSNFREHVSICQVPHISNGDNSSLKSSLQGGRAPPNHSSMVTLARPVQLPCPGFSFEKMFGKDYRSLLDHEREQVNRAAEVAGLLWLNSKEKSSIISKSCSKESPSHRVPAQPCHNCSKILKLSGFKDTLCLYPKTSKSRRYSPFRDI